MAVLTVSYGSSLRAYLQQRSQIADLKVQIEQKRASIDVLEREKRRWDDSAFLEAQARDRFGWVKPGQTSYVVLDEDGQPLRTTAVLNDPDTLVRESPTAWYDTAWASMELAGNPPPERKQGRPPATEIDGTDE